MADGSTLADAVVRENGLKAFSVVANLRSVGKAGAACIAGKDAQTDLRTHEEILAGVKTGAYDNRDHAIVKLYATAKVLPEEMAIAGSANACYVVGKAVFPLELAT